MNLVIKITPPADSAENFFLLFLILLLIEERKVRIRLRAMENRGFMVPMHAEKSRKRALQEPGLGMEFRLQAVGKA